MEFMLESENFCRQTRVCESSNSAGNQENFHLNFAVKLKHGSEGLLTKRESLIAAYLVSGYTVNEIAGFLSRSRNTIKMHIKNMKKKCKCETQTKFGAILQGFIKNHP